MLQSMESQSRTRLFNKKVMYRCHFSKGLSNSSQSSPRKILILSLELPSYISTKRINLLGQAAVQNYPQAHQDSTCFWPPCLSPWLSLIRLAPLTFLISCRKLLLQLSYLTLPILNQGPLLFVPIDPLLDSYHTIYLNTPNYPVDPNLPFFRF